MQKDKGVGGFLNKKEGGQGALGIFALLSFLPTAKQGREGRLAGGDPGRRLRACGRLRSEGKERGRREGPIPGRGSARGGLRWPSHDGRRQRAAGGAGPVPQGCGGGQGGGGKHWGTRGARFPLLTLDWNGAGRSVHRRQARWQSKLAAAALRGLGES